MKVGTMHPRGPWPVCCNGHCMAQTVHELPTITPSMYFQERLYPLIYCVPVLIICQSHRGHCLMMVNLTREMASQAHHRGNDDARLHHHVQQPQVPHPTQALPNYQLARTSLSHLRQIEVWASMLWFGFGWCAFTLFMRLVSCTYWDWTRGVPCGCGIC